MLSRRTPKSVSLATLLIFGSGCNLYQPRPVTFRVRDGDTGQPVARARVEAEWNAIDFGKWLASVGPREGVTDRDGNLTLVIDPHKPFFKLRVTADGYPEDDPELGRVVFGAPRWDRLVPGPWYSPRDECEVRLYCGPQPTADVAVPDGYRGAVLVRFATGGDPPVLAGQRAFSYRSSTQGVVVVADGGFFEAVGSYAGIRARYANRPAFPTCVPDRHRPDRHCPPDDAVALRFITPVWERHTWLYVLGTAAEAEAVERAVWPDHNHFDQAAFDQIVKSHEPPAPAPQR
jgi:hypothetical protein